MATNATVHCETTLPSGRHASYTRRVDTTRHENVEQAIMSALEARHSGFGVFLGCEVSIVLPTGITERRVLDFEGAYVLRRL